MRKFLYILAGFLGIIAFGVSSYFLFQKHKVDIVNNPFHEETNNSSDETNQLHQKDETHRYSNWATFTPSSGVKIERALYKYESKYDAFSSVPNPEQMSINFKFIDDDSDSLDVSCFYLTKLRVSLKESGKELAYFTGKEFVDIHSGDFTNAYIFFDNDKFDSTYFVNKGLESTYLDFDAVEFTLEYEVNPEYRPEGLTIEYKSFEFVSSDLFVHATFKNNTGVEIKKINDFGVIVAGINYDQGFNWDEYTSVLSVATFEFTDFTQGSSCDETFTFPTGSYNASFFNSDLSGAYITMYYRGIVSRD